MERGKGLYILSVIGARIAFGLLSEQQENKVCNSSIPLQAKAPRIEKERKKLIPAGFRP